MNSKIKNKNFMKNTFYGQKKTNMLNKNSSHMPRLQMLKDKETIYENDNDMLKNSETKKSKIVTFVTYIQKQVKQNMLKIAIEGFNHREKFMTAGKSLFASCHKFFHKFLNASLINGERDALSLIKLENTEFVQKSIEVIGHCNQFSKISTKIRSFKIIEYTKGKSRLFSISICFLIVGIGTITSSFFSSFFSNKGKDTKLSTEPGIKISRELYKPQPFKMPNGDKIRINRRKLPRWIKRLLAFLSFFAILLLLQLLSYLLKRFGYINLDFFDLFQYYFQLAIDNIIDFIKSIFGIPAIEDSLYTFRKQFFSHTNTLASLDVRIKTLLDRFEKLSKRIKDEIKTEIMNDVELAIAKQSKEISEHVKKYLEKSKKELFSELFEKLNKELGSKKPNSSKTDENRLGKILKTRKKRNITKE